MGVVKVHADFQCGSGRWACGSTDRLHSVLGLRAIWSIWVVLAGVRPETGLRHVLTSPFTDLHRNVPEKIGDLDVTYDLQAYKDGQTAAT